MAGLIRAIMLPGPHNSSQTPINEGAAGTGPFGNPSVAESSHFKYTANQSEEP